MISPDERTRSFRGYTLKAGQELVPRQTKMASSAEGDIVVLVLTNPSESKAELTMEEAASISISDIENWNLSLILSSRIVKVEADRNRLMQQSSYFRSLLGGSFSESSLDHVVVQWDLEIVVVVLRFIHGLSINATPDNFIPLLEGALFFGVEGLLLECENWFYKCTSTTGTSTSQMPLETMLEIWNFGVEHGIGFIQDLCRECLAWKFEWATSCSSFTCIPYNLLSSCMEHPHLTVSSEKQLCEALLTWISSNIKSSEFSHFNCGNNYLDILKKVRICLLPLQFSTGQRRHFPQFADECVSKILHLIGNHSAFLQHAVTDNNIQNYQVRLTKYSEKIAVAGCPQITIGFLFLAVLPLDTDAKLKKRIVNALIELDCGGGDYLQSFNKSFCSLSFEAVREVDISKCPKLRFGAVIEWLHLAFPSLRILKASHLLDFKMDHLLHLMQKCHLIQEVDLTVDISPVISAKIPNLSTTEGYGLSKRTSNMVSNEGISNFMLGELGFSNIAKLTLEGRNDINDMDLLCVSSHLGSLSYLNIRGCTLVTDMGISKLISKCININSLILSYTSFGRNSVLALCSDISISDASAGGPRVSELSGTMAFRLLQLQIDGCKGVGEDSMLQLMSQAFMLKILSLKDTSLVDDALYNFRGSSLESLNVSATKVSEHALTFTISRNPDIRFFEATGCKNLHQHGHNKWPSGIATRYGELFFELGKKTFLIELALGWGFSSAALENLGVTIRKLRAISLGLGTSLHHDLLCGLPKLCPLLEFVSLTFQGVSDDIVRSLLGSLKHLQVLELRCCLGDLTPFCFQLGMLSLRILRLEWITPWMTNDDLATLTQNCFSLVELSLSGCKLLDSDSQNIISFGWPGLTVLHLEECGNITADGVSSFFDCKAIEDLLLRHNGHGIGRKFIAAAAAELPLLRKLAMDLCDACDGGFESPSHDERCFLSNVRIARCKSQRCGFELGETKAFKPVHKETIVLEWSRTELKTTVVKERI